ncbi:MAG: co-chaperone GroES [Sulfurimonas sp.]|jgi:co-chaperonin GroES (HSP10)
MIKPANGYVLCKKSNVEKKTESGIIVATGLRQKGYDDHIQAEIIDIAIDSLIDGIETKELFIKGDTILFKKGLSEKLELEFDSKTEYYLVKKDDIMGIL